MEKDAVHAISISDKNSAIYGPVSRGDWCQVSFKQTHIETTAVTSAVTMAWNGVLSARAGDRHPTHLCLLNENSRLHLHLHLHLIF